MNAPLPAPVAVARADVVSYPGPWDYSESAAKGADVRRLAVLAHFDPRGAVRPHVRRHAASLAAAVDDVVVVTTADLTAKARASLHQYGRLVERKNYGYDFFSYKVGLDSVDLTAYDEVTVCNDSYLGPVTSYSEIFEQMSGRKADFWGLSESDRVSHHVQSFFLTFRPSVLASDTFRQFWGEMQPLSRRWNVIRRYEVGLSTALYAADFTSTPYFVETEADRRTARRRVRWWALRRLGLPRTPEAWAVLRARAKDPWNPAAGLADRVLDGGRLPYVKLDTLRYDPYDLDADRLLRLCEERFPNDFDGVRRLLLNTAKAYPPRPREQLKTLPSALRPLRTLVRYRAPH